MKLYTYYDKDDHPVAEASTESGLARKIGVSPSAVCKGLRKGSKRYSVEEVEEDGMYNNPDLYQSH